MIFKSHMQKNIQIYLCLLKFSRKQESVTDGQTDGQTDGRTDRRTDGQTATITISTHRYRGGIKIDKGGYLLNL